MQSIERYGVVALLFLVVTVIAVLVWEGDPSMLPGSDVAFAEDTGPAEVAPAPGRIKMTARPIRQPLSRAALEVTESTRDMPEREPGQNDRPVEVPNERNGNAGIVPAGGENAFGAQQVAEPPNSSGPSGTTRPERRGGRRGGKNRSGPTGAAPAESAVERPAAPGQPDATRVYEVAPGDTLSEIAMEQLGTMKRWKEIAALNPGVDPSRLFVGQKIVLPGTGASPPRVVESASPAPARESAAEAPSNGEGYAVRSGDSMWLIAQRTLGDGERWREIARLNPTVDANRLRVGQRLVVPTGARVETAGAMVADASVAPRDTNAPRRGRVR